MTVSHINWEQSNRKLKIVPPEKDSKGCMVVLPTCIEVVAPSTPGRDVRGVTNGQ